jgi:hypothetical protein
MPEATLRPSRLDRLYHAALAALLLALGALLVWRPLYGFLDFWAHAAVGRWIWQTGRVPDHTLFLWTADEPWVYHSWLFQVLAYGLTEVGGPEQLPYVVLGFTLVMVLLPFVLAWLVWRRGGRLSSWLAIPFALALEGPAIRFQTRPELFTVLGVCVFLAFLVAWSGRLRAERLDPISRRHRLGLVAVGAMCAVWANLHGGVVIGLLILAVTAVCDLVQDRFDPRSRWLAALAAVAPLAVCLNPYGWAYWQSLRPVGGRTFGHVLEWVPVWRSPALPADVAVPVAILAAISLVAWLMNPRRRWAHLGWLVVLAALFLEARRNVWPFALTCLMVLAANSAALDAETFWQRAVRRLRPADTVPDGVPAPLRWVVRAAILIGVAFASLEAALEIRPWQPLTPDRLEQGAVRFLRQHELSRRLFNDYENSSYLQWQLAGHPALYIDLLNAYPGAVMRDYQRIAYLEGWGRELLNEQRIEVVLLTTNRGGSESLAALADDLDGAPDWARVYVGTDGVIWVRMTPEYRPLWERPLSYTQFANLERWGNDTDVVSPAVLPPSLGPPKVKPVGGWRKD